jgi:hypothetical protein
MYDENELLEAIFDGVKKWAFNNNVLSEDFDLIRQWATGDSPASLRVEIEGQVFTIQVVENEE